MEDVQALEALELAYNRFAVPLKEAFEAAQEVVELRRELTSMMVYKENLSVEVGTLNSQVEKLAQEKIGLEDICESLRQHNDGVAKAFSEDFRREQDAWLEQESLHKERIQALKDEESRVEVRVGQLKADHTTMAQRVNEAKEALAKEREKLDEVKAQIPLMGDELDRVIKEIEAKKREYRDFLKKIVGESGE